MNYITKKAWSAKARNTVAFVFLLMLSLQAVAQDYYLQSQTLKSGDAVSYTATDRIYSVINAPFIVESGGQAELKAGKRIELYPGFKVLDGGRLSATLEISSPVPPGGDKESISVFPNPTDGIINIVSAQNVNAARLIDMYGFLIIEQYDINTTKFSMDISAVKAGFYILEIISDKATEIVRIEKN